jgi:hypothetical protein
MKRVALNDTIVNKYDIDLLQNIQDNMKYANDTIFVDKPVTQRFYSNESQDDEVWVWSGFMPPGAHKCVIHDPINTSVVKNVAVGPRKEGLEPNFFDSNLALEEEAE